MINISFKAKFFYISSYIHYSKKLSLFGLVRNFNSKGVNFRLYDFFSGWHCPVLLNVYPKTNYGIIILYRYKYKISLLFNFKNHSFFFLSLSILSFFLISYIFLFPCSLSLFLIINEIIDFWLIKFENCVRISKVYLLTGGLIKYCQELSGLWTPKLFIFWDEG